MKKFFTLLTIIIATVGFANAQQVIGSFPNQDGGLEGQTIEALTTISSTSKYWLSSSATGSIVSSSPRTGLKCANIQMSGTSHRTLRGPAIETFTAISYIIQFYYKGDKTDDGTSDFGDLRGGVNGSTYNYGAYVTNANTGSTWTKYTAAVSPGAVSGVGHCVVSVIEASSKTGNFDIDDIVIYAGSSADVTPANAATVPVFSNVTTTTQDLSWTAASGGVDGGGYVVVRGVTDPTTTPNANGVYAVGNTVAAGETIVYIGTSTSFTDNTLSANTQYFYRIYTVDKAFNYSSALTANNTTALPISLVKFTADKLSEKVKLNWVTATEINNDKFVVERSADGENFELLSEVKGAGNSREINSYNVVDAAPLKGTSYYRLTQVDFNGASETFAPVAVNMSGKLHLATVQSNTEAGNIDLNIYSPSATSTSIRVTDLSGRTIASQQVNLVEGYQSVNINTNNLSSGIHIIQIMNGEEVVMKKLVL